MWKFEIYLALSISHLNFPERSSFHNADIHVFNSCYAVGTFCYYIATGNPDRKYGSPRILLPVANITDFNSFASIRSFTTTVKLPPTY